jgi:uncharacterized protein
MTMTSTSTAPPARLSRDDTGTLLGQTMGLVALTAALFALGAYVGRDLSGGWAIGSYIAALVLLLGPPLLAASIFLDVLNVFLLFLSLFGRDN